MSGRRSAAEAAQTRARLVDRATAMASVEGLEGMTIGRLAEVAGVSKSGVTRHFPSKEELQLQALEHAAELFTAAVWAPVADREPGLDRLLGVCDSWPQYLADGVFPGGCFLTAAATEFDGRDGRVRDAIGATLLRWWRVLGAEVRTAVERGELAAGTDARELVFELNALAVGANQAFQLFGDHEAIERSRRLMRRAVLATAPPR